jgi:hypothetical protein
MDKLKLSKQHLNSQKTTNPEGERRNMNRGPKPRDNAHELKGGNNNHPNPKPKSGS